MTSVNLLRVSALGCQPQQVYTARHDTLNTTHLHEISSDYNIRDRCVYTDSIQNKHVATNLYLERLSHSFGVTTL